MAASTVRLEADISALSRAFGQMRAQYSAALSAMRSDARREATARVALERQALAEQGRNHRAAMQIQAAQARAAAAQEARIARDLNRQRQREEAASVRAKQSAEAAVVRAAENSARQQQRAFSRMLREKISEERRAAAESDRLQRQQTANADRALRARLADQTRAYREESRLRQQAANEARRTYERQEREHRRTTTTRGANVARAAGAGVGAAAQIGSSAHGQMTDARRQVAEQQQALYRALVESGATGADAAAMSRRAVSYSYQQGVDPQALLGGIARAQTEFSVLGSANERENMTPEERTRSVQQALNRALGEGVRGQRLGSDPGETLRLLGMFRQAGFNDDTSRDLITRTVALAQRGAVEMSAVSAEAMAPIQRRMNQAAETVDLSGATSDEERARLRNQAMQRAYVQSFAETQIMRSRGFSVRGGANAMAAMDQALIGGRTADAMRNNLQNALEASRGSSPEAVARRQRINRLMSAGEGGLFEEDTERPGQMRLRREYRGNALSLAETLASAGLSSTETQSIFAGSGPGDRQALQSNWRQVMGAMMATNAQGVSGASATRELMQANLSPAEQARIEAANAGDPMAEYLRREGERLDALTNNTAGITTLSQRIEDFTARNPLASTVMGGLSGIVGGLAMRAIPGLVGAGSSAAGALGLSGIGASIASVALPLLATVGAGATGGLIGYGINRARGFSAAEANPFAGQFWSDFGSSISYVMDGGQPAIASGVPASGVPQGGGAPGGGMASEVISTSVETGVRRALQGVTINAAVDSHSVQQVTSTNASRNASGGR